MTRYYIEKSSPVDGVIPSQPSSQPHTDFPFNTLTIPAGCKNNTFKILVVGVKLPNFKYILRVIPMQPQMLTGPWPGNISGLGPIWNLGIRPWDWTGPSP